MSPALVVSISSRQSTLSSGRRHEFCRCLISFQPPRTAGVFILNPYYIAQKLFHSFIHTASSDTHVNITRNDSSIPYCKLIPINSTFLTQNSIIPPIIPSDITHPPLLTRHTSMVPLHPWSCIFIGAATANCSCRAQI